MELPLKEKCAKYLLYLERTRCIHSAWHKPKLQLGHFEIMLLNPQRHDTECPSSYESADSLQQHHMCLNKTVCVCPIGFSQWIFKCHSNFLLPIDITWSSFLSDANWQSEHATSLHWRDQSFSPLFAASEEADGSLSSYDSTAVWECSRTLQCFTEIRPRQQSHTPDSHFSSPPSFLTLTVPSHCSDVLFLHAQIY